MATATGKSAMRSRTVNGTVYIRREDVVQYLRETAHDWATESRSEATITAVVCVNQIADQIEKVA